MAAATSPLGTQGEPLQIIAVLDATAPVALDEVIARLPERAEEPLVFRLRDRIDPTDEDARAFKDVLERVAELAQQVLSAAEGQVCECYVAGADPPPLFVALGGLLAALAAPVTVFSPALASAWEEVALDPPTTTTAGGPEVRFFEVCRMHGDPGDPKTDGATLGLLVSTSGAGTEDGTPDPTGLPPRWLELRTSQWSAPGTITGVTTAQAAKEIQEALAAQRQRNPAPLSILVADVQALALLVGRTAARAWLPGQILVLHPTAARLEATPLPAIAPPREPEAPRDLIALLQRAQEGDQAALDLLLRTLLPWIKRTVRQHRPVRRDSIVDSDDVTMDSLLRFVRNFQRVRAKSTTALLSYVRQLIIHVICDHERRARAEQRRPLGPLNAEQPDPEAQLHTKQSWQSLLAGMADLPSLQRDALLLSYGRGLSLPKVAERLGESPSAAAAHLYRAIRRVRAAVERRPAPEPADDEFAQGGDVVAAYLREVTAGRRPDRAAVLAAHPQDGDRLAPLLDALDWFAQQLYA